MKTVVDQGALWYRTIADTEEKLIRKAIRSTRGNLSKASRALGISYPTVLGRMKRYGIKKEAA